MSRFALILPMCAALALFACRRDDRPPSASFAASLRCGMTRAEVTQLARRHGYNDSDRSWLARQTSRKKDGSKELSLLDFTFREGRLVALTERRYDPRTRRVESREIDLCRDPR